jgi:T1SS-143 domain-containing protein
MNGPFRIAQADNTGTGGNNKQQRIVKITKPYGDQSVVVPLSYDGSVKADLTAIASEKITLVHLGEKLIILFDNHSTVTLEPFFDSTGKPLGDLTVEVSPGRDVTSAEFATLFPVTDDQSVLPAAGTGDGSGAQASGANFTSVGVDPLAVGNPLPLLGQEDLPSFVINNILATEFINDKPTALANAELSFDEDGLPGGNLGGIGDLDPTTNGPIFLTGTLGHNYGLDHDGVHESTLFVATGAPNGFTYTVSNGGLVLTVSQIQDGVSVDVLRITLSNAIDGNYTIQQLHAIDHAPGGNENDQLFTFNYVVTDSNGDTANGSLGLSVNDDTPTVAANAPITFDEDALPGGNLGGVGDFDPTTNGPITASGTLSHSYGADGAGSVLLSATGAPEGFTYSVNGAGTILTVSQIQDGVSVSVLQIVLTDRTSGHYTITQLHAINHAPGLDENNQNFTFNYTVTDHDGDTASGTLALTVNDDTPVALSGTVGGEGEGEGNYYGVFATVYEDGLTLANSDGQSVGNPEGYNTNTSVHILAADLASLVSFGADQPGSFHLNPNAVAPALFSHGDAVTYSVSGDTLTASAGGRVVFTLHDNGDQTFTFVLKDQLDHANGSGDYATLTINLASAFIATDSDGDSVVLDGTINIAVENDVPVQNFSASVSGSVQEDALTLANSDGHAVGNPEGSDQTTVATGSLSSLVWVGADEPGTFSLESSPGGLPSITSHGAAVQYSVSGDTLTAYVDSNHNGQLDAGDRDIFTLQVSSNGDYKFTLLDKIDHLPNVPANDDTQTLILNLSSAIKFTDFDGDSITLSGGFRVSIEDDIPVVIGSGTVTYHADEGDIVTLQSVGTTPNDGNADGSYTGWPTTDIGVGPAVVSGSVSGAVSFGADGEGGFSFAANTISTLQGLGLTSHGGTLSYAIVGDTIIAYVNNAFSGYQPLIDRTVFTLSLNHTSGDFLFTLNDQLDHVPGGAKNTDLQGSNGAVSGLDFGSLIVATDGDGDTVTLDGKLTIEITDDIPKIIAFDLTGKTVTIDETAGQQGNDTTSSSIAHQFDGVAHVGHDPDMGNTPQFAFNNSAIVAGLFVPGADEPAHAVLSLTISADGVDSGLTTTDGHHIYLFNENGIIVGRIDGDGGGVTSGGSAADVAAFAISINQDGKISVAQYLSIHNDNPNDPNDTMTLGTKISAQLAVTDNDGDTVTKSVTIGSAIHFNDDGPTLVGSGSVTYHADEGDIVTLLSVGTSPNDGNADGSFTGWPTADVGVGPAVVSGSISTVVNFGADGEGGFSFASNTLSTLQGLGLTSNGDALSYTIVGDTIVAYVNGLFGGYQPLFDRTVFTLSLNHTSGDFLFTLNDQLDHVAGGGKNTDLQGANGVVSGLDFGSLIVATDGDGDSITLNGKLTVEITDDVPKITSFHETGATVTIDETAGKQGNDTTSSSIAHLFDGVAHVGHDPDMGNAPQFAYNSAPIVVGSFVPGADEPATYQITLQINGQPSGNGGVDSGLTTTDGHHIYLFSEGGIIVGRIDGNNDGHINSNSADVAAFAISIDQLGRLSVAQYLSIHNDNPNDPNDTMTLGAKISAQLAVTDNDGDTVTQSVAIGSDIHFNDDGPTVVGSGGVTYHADEGDIITLLSVGTTPDDGNADGSTTGQFDIAGPATVSGSVFGVVNFGADGEGGFSFAANTVSTLQALGLTSNGGTLSYAIVGDTVIAYVNNALGGYQPLIDRTVFTLSLDHTSGDFQFKLFDQLDHVAGGGKNTDLQGANGVVSGLDFGSLIVATDGDGDSVTLNGKLTIEITDDIPKITSFHETGATVTVDETAGKQSDDTTSSSVVHQFDSVAQVGHDPDMGNAPQFAFNLAPIVVGSFVPGTDEPATYQITLQINGQPSANGGVDSGLTTTDGHHIYLFSEGGIIVGRIDGNNDGHIDGNAADVAAFAVSINQFGQVSVAQYLSIHHNDATNPNDTMNLGATISAQLAVTDNDGDTVTQSVTIGNDIHFNDDGPKVSSIFASGSVIQDETPGVTGADPVPSNDVSSADLPTGVLALFDAVANKGVDSDVSNALKDHDALGFATSAGSVVHVVANFGADGPATSDSQILSLSINGGDGANSGLKTTDGHEIDLFLEGGLIVGRYDSDNSGQVTSADAAAFAIALGQDGTISVAQYVSLFNPTPGSSYDEAATGLKNIQATVTLTDGDGDHTSQSVNISNNIVFQDDGPTLTVTAPAAINGLDFGNFVLNGNEWGNGSGVATGTNGGWTISDANDGHSAGDQIGNTGGGTVQLERVGDGYEGMHSSNNGYMVDLDASPHDVKISQTVTGLVTGQVYDLRFEAGAPFPNSAHMEVWFGGVRVFDLAPNGQMTAYDIQLVGGSGDGSNLLEFRETGTPDNQGTYLANVSVGQIVIDETAGNQPNTNDVNPNNLFDAVAHQGTDPDMAGPQFAAGISAVVNVAANFGADGPWHGSVTEATVYSLNTTNAMDSGLSTTAGQHIYLFNETYGGVTYVVGRYDSDNSGSVSNAGYGNNTVADAAAFAFRVDPTTGVLSLVQYVSLHQPDTLSNNEGVFLNSGSLVVKVTVTDGDGDTATQSADISANIRFDDDGPQAALVATSATLTIDETAGQDAGTNDVAHIADYTALFSAIVGTPIEIAQSQSALVSATGTVYGADGQGAAPAFALNVSFNGVDSGLDATDGRSVFLFKEGNLIVGREGTAGGAADANGSVAFAIALDSSTGVLTVAEYTALYHHNPLDPNEAATPLSIANDVLQATVTVTDGDGDTSVASVGIGGQIHFLDDGPTVAPAPLNQIVNGDFSQGVWSTPDWWGSMSTNVTGWTLGQSPVGPGTVDLERTASGYLNMTTSNGADMVDMGSSPGNIEISQHFTTLTANQTYAIQFEAGAPFPETAELQVVWNGQVIGTINPSGPGALTSYNYIVTATGNDTLTFVEIGTGNAPITETWQGHNLATEDYHGTYLANVGLVATYVVDEDGLPAGNQDLPTPSEGDAPGLATSVVGDLHINWGADNYDSATPDTVDANRFYQDNDAGTLVGRNVTFTNTDIGVSGGLSYTSLTSHGDQVVLSLDSSGTHLIGSATHNGVTREVFEVSLSDDGTGAFKFTLHDALDHAPNGSENDIDITFNFTATDSDGDSATGTFTVGVDDDVPVATAPGDTVSVNEANLPSDANPSGHTQAAVGFLHINWGADNGDAKHLAFVKDADGHVVGPALTSDGVQLDYVIRFPSDSPGNEQIVAYKHGDDPDTNPVFSITLYEQGHGYYAYAQYQNIDHSAQGTDLDVLNFNVIATDDDGDSIQTSITVNVTDDVPHAVLTSTETPLIVDETAGQDAGTNDVASTPALLALFDGSWGAPIQIAQSGAAMFSTAGSTYGADGPGGASVFGLHVVNGTDSGLNATDGRSIYLYQEGNLIVGREGDAGTDAANAGGPVAFALSIDSATGQITLAEYTAIQHPDHSDPNEALAPQTIAVGAAEVTFTVTDGDHDTSVATVDLNGLIQFRDDGPSVTAQTNLIVNGSFEQGHDDLQAGQWSIYHTLSGTWTSADTGNGNVPFEVQVNNSNGSGPGGVPAEDGQALIELDSDLSGGNLSGGDHVNNTGHTNSTIQQVIAGTEAGQTYELTFWYAPRPGEGNADSGSMNVLWNGAVVKTIDSSDFTPGVWQQITVFVEGTGANNVLAFQAEGQENSLGALIDNVSLVAAVAVDEDGLTGPNAFGNHDSQPGDIVVPNGDGDNNEATATGLLGIKWGADSADSGTDTTDNSLGAFGTLVQDHPDGAGDRSVTFGSNALAAFSGTLTAGHLTSHGEDIQLSFNADHTVLYGTAGTVGVDARTVFEVSLSDDGSGSFRFVLKDALDHAPGQGENNINLSFNYIATDSDGDSAPGTFSVVVNDDVPVAAGSASVTGEVDEDGLQPADLSTGNTDAGREGETVGTGHATVTGDVGSLNSLVNFGADGPGAHPFQIVSQSQASTWISNLHLFSQGSAVDHATVSGDTVTAFAHDNRAVFSLTVNDNGSWTFTLLDQVDHPLVDDPNTPTHEIAFEDTLTINLGGLVAAVDGDGDPAPLSGANFQVTIRDDVPYFGTVSTDTVTHLNTITTGTFDFHVGADEPGHFTVTPPTIDGVDVVTATDAQTGIITLTATFHDTGATYYVLNVNPNGTYSFEIDSLPTTPTPFNTVTLNAGFGPTPSYDAGPFTFSSDQNVNGSGQGIGVSNNGMGDGEHLTIKFDNPMTVANLHFNQEGGSDVTITWIASSSTSPGHQETGSFTIPKTENGSGLYPIDILAHIQGGGNDISSFDTLELSASTDGSGKVRIESIGGTEITQNTDVGPFDFALTGTDFDGDAATTTLHIDADLYTPPSVTGTVDTLTLYESDLDKTQDGNDLVAGTVTGTHPDGTGETAQDNHLSFVAGSEAINVAFADPTDAAHWTAPTVSGLDAGYSLSWRLDGTSHELIGTLLHGATNLGDAIFLDLSGTTAGPGGTATPTVTGTLAEALHDALGSDQVTVSGLNIVATDAHGGTATGSVTVNVIDDAPVVTQAAYVGAVNEANLGSSDPQHVQSDFGGLGINFGADGPGTLVFQRDSNGDLIKPTGYSSDGVPLDYTIISAGGGAEELVAFKQGDDPTHAVFTVTLINQNSPQYFFLLYQNLTHSAMGTDVTTLNFNVVATDGDGDSVTQAVSVKVTDDVPHASADVATTESGDHITGNVLTNDSAGADFPLTVLGFDAGDMPGGTGGTGGAGGDAGFFGGTGGAGGAGGAAGGPSGTGGTGGPGGAGGDASNIFGDGGAGGNGGNAAYLENIGHAVAGQYGTLTLHTDGTYTYQANPNVSGDDVFHYTVMDNDGDTSTATLTITVTNGQPTVAAAMDLVTEAGLSDGSTPGVGDTTGAGHHLTFSDPQGDTVTVSHVNGTDVTANGTVVAGTYGNLIINLDGSYTYTLTSNDLHHSTQGTATDDQADVFNYTVTDSHGNTQSSTLTINIADDVPTAHDGTNSVTEGASITGGNVLTDGTANDVFGADGAHAGGGVTGVATGSDTTNPVSGNLGGLAGQYGTLTLHADGTYTYKADPDKITANAVDHFVYTITDGDGDTSTARLDITVNNVTLVADNVTKGVSEAALDTVMDPAGGGVPADLAAATVTGSDPTSRAETTFGQLNVTGGSGIHYTAQDVTTNNGVFHLGTDGQWTYTLTSPYETTPHSNGANNVTGDHFTYTATDALGNTTTGTIQINVADDKPTAHADTDSVGTGTSTDGNVISGLGTDGGTTGSGVDIQGADGAHVSHIQSTNVGGVGTDVSGSTAIGGQYGTLTIDANGHYDYARTSSSGGTDTFTYTLTDGDGDTSTATLTVTLDDMGKLVIGSNASDDGVPDSGQTPDPAHAVDVTTNTTGPINGGAGNDAIAGDPGGTTVIQAGATANIVFVLDVSASMSTAIPGSTDRMTAMQTALKQALVTLSNSGAEDIRVHIVAFGLAATDLGTFDVRVNGAAQSLTAVNAAIDTLDNIETSGTNYEDGLYKASQWINGTPDGTSGPLSDATVNKVLFISDGEPNTWDIGNTYTSHNNPSTSGFDQAALDNVTGTYNPSGTTNDDTIDERLLITNSAATWDNAHPFTIEAIGINLSDSTALSHLSVVEGTGGQATNVTTAQGLVDAVGTLATSTTAPTAAGNDIINGGAGNDIIYGDVMNTDALRVAANLTTLQNGSGWAVFAALEGTTTAFTTANDPAGDGAQWTRADTLAYISAHKSELSAEAGRTDGNDNITGGKGDDIIYAQEGNDTINYAQGDGHDIVDGGTGSDTLHITGATGTVTIAAASGGPDIVPANGPNYTDIIVTMSDGGTIRMDSVEDIIVDLGVGGGTVNYATPMTGTALDTTTITINGGAGNDTIDLTGRDSGGPTPSGDTHHVVVDGGGNTTGPGDLGDVVKLDFRVSDITAITHSGANDVQISHNGIIDSFTNIETFYFVGDASAHSLADVQNIDLVPPTLTSITMDDTALGIGESATVTVKFSEAVTGLAIGDFTAPNGTLSNLVSSDGGTTWTMKLAPDSGVTAVDNLITLANGSYTDLAGNPGSGGVSTAYAVDTVAPTVTINQAATQTDPGIGTVHFTVAFSEAVTDFTADDIQLTGAAAVGLIATNIAITPSGGTTYDVAVSGFTHDGDLTASIAAGMAHDAAGNANLASTSTDHTVTVTLDQPPSDIVFSGNTGLSSSDVTGPALFTASAVDSDDAAGFVYKFYNTDGSLTGTQANGGETFSINSSTGVVTSSNATTNSTYTLVVDAADSHGAHYHETVSLILGTTGNNSLGSSSASNDQVIYGFGGFDTITGGSGNDYLVGGGIPSSGSGTETLSGGAGNDWIVYEAGNSGGRTVVLDGGADNDTLVITGSSSLPTVDLSQTSDQTTNDRATVTNFENVDASGATAAISITGSSVANILIGGTDGDTLVGGGGVDTLTGNGGADHFRFNALSELGDHITDFSGSSGNHDVIDLLNSAFSGVSWNGNNTLNETIYTGNDAATHTLGASQHFAYDSSTGTLYYDANGGGDASRMVLAILDNHAAIAATDIHKV